MGGRSQRCSSRDSSFGLDSRDVSRLKFQSLRTLSLCLSLGLETSSLGLSLGLEYVSSCSVLTIEVNRSVQVRLGL